jgi:hypothetical protein
MARLTGPASATSTLPPCFCRTTPANANVVTLHDQISVPRDAKDPQIQSMTMFPCWARPSATASPARSARALRRPQGARHVLKTIHATAPATSLPRRPTHRRIAGAAGGLRLLGLPLQAALPVAALDLRPHGAELGMVHPHPHADHQHCRAAAAHHQHEVRAEDAENPAAGCGHPRKVQEIQDGRPPPGGHEPRAGASTK